MDTRHIYNRIYAHALANYNNGGWDYFVECCGYEDFCRDAAKHNWHSYEEAIWVWPVKAPRDADDHWLRPATRPALVALDDKPIWVESVNVRRKAEIPDIVISQMLDRGERGVRRSLREWPYGKTLRHETARQPGDLEDTFQIRWYWAASP